MTKIYYILEIKDNSYYDEHSNYPMGWKGIGSKQVAYRFDTIKAANRAKIYPTWKVIQCIEKVEYTYID